MYVNILLININNSIDHIFISKYTFQLKFALLTEVNRHR